MTIATTKPMALDEYLRYDDGTDARYELVDGVLVEMGAESDLNVVIASFLFAVFLQLGTPYYCVRRGTEIATPMGQATSRYPDLMILTEAGAAALSGQRRSLIMPDMPVPLLVVEVVSSSDTDKKSRDRDYTEKRAEYAARGIPEYWIVDPIAAVVWVLRLEGDQYQESGFAGAQGIVSPGFAGLELTAEQVLMAGR